MEIISYQTNYRHAAIALMAELQDHEHKLCPELAPTGSAVAEAHFNYLIQHCQQQQGAIYVAVEGEQALGLISVYLEQEDADAQHIYPEHKRYGYIADVVVAASHRRQGVAQRLMQKAEQHCIALGLTRIKVSSLACNTNACDFYQTIGYKHTEQVFTKSLIK